MRITEIAQVSSYNLNAVKITRFLSEARGSYNLNAVRITWFLCLVFFFTLFLLPKAVFSQVPTMTLYVGEGCPHCAVVKQYIKEKGLDRSYAIGIKEVYFNRENAQELTKLFEERNIPLLERGVPVLLAEGKFYVGADKIKDYLSCLKVEEEPTCEKPSLLLPTLIAGALADSINPCEFAILILLLTTILAAGGASEAKMGWFDRLLARLLRRPSSISSQRALKAGLLFSLAIFLSYLAMGLGLYKALTFGNLPQIFTKVIASLAIIFGLLNLKDYFWYGRGGFVMEVPMSWRPRLKSLVASATSPFGAFLIGFLVSLFLLPCTSGPYLVVLGMLAQRTQFTKAFAYLILYNLIFIIPMVLLTLAVYKGLSPEKAEEIRQKRLRVLHLITGVILVGMGAIILVGLV